MRIWWFQLGPCDREKLNQIDDKLDQILKELKKMVATVADV